MVQGGPALAPVLHQQLKLLLVSQSGLGSLHVGERGLTLVEHGLEARPAPAVPVRGRGPAGAWVSTDADCVCWCSSQLVLRFDLRFAGLGGCTEAHDPRPQRVHQRRLMAGHHDRQALAHLMLQPSAQPGDALDVEALLPGSSITSSLRGRTRAVARASLRRWPLDSVPGIQAGLRDRLHLIEHLVDRRVRSASPWARASRSRCSTTDRSGRNPGRPRWWQHRGGMPGRFR